MSSPNYSFTLRLATRADAVLLADIHRECFPHYWDSDAFTGFFAVSGTLALVVEEEGEPAGMMVYRLQHEEAEIITLAVRPGWRRRGMARALLETAMAQGRARGAARLLLDVEENNQAALQLYEQYGFSEIRRRKQYYRQKDGSYTDALVMQLKLD